jgi:hypothetical protein
MILQIYLGGMLLTLIISWKLRHKWRNGNDDFLLMIIILPITWPLALLTFPVFIGDWASSNGDKIVKFIEKGFKR